jgi:hypothetical protein
VLLQVEGEKVFETAAEPFTYVPPLIAGAMFTVALAWLKSALIMVAGAVWQVEQALG